MQPFLVPIGFYGLCAWLGWCVCAFVNFWGYALGSVVSIGALTRRQLCRDWSRTIVAGKVRTLSCAATGLESLSPSFFPDGRLCTMLGLFR